MKAPDLWLQILIAYIGFSLLPTVIAILAKLRILPLCVYLLIADSYPKLIADHKALCTFLLVVFVAHPILTLIRKIYGYWKAEQEARAYLLTTARPFYPEIELPEGWVIESEGMDW